MRSSTCRALLLASFLFSFACLSMPGCQPAGSELADFFDEAQMLGADTQKAVIADETKAPKLTATPVAAAMLDAVDAGDGYPTPKGTRKLMRMPGMIAVGLVGDVQDELNKKVILQQLCDATGPLAGYAPGDETAKGVFLFKALSQPSRDKKSVVAEGQQASGGATSVLGVKSGNPVFVDANNGLLLIPTDEIIVCLKDGTDPQSYFGAEWANVKPIEGAINQFVVTLPGLSAEQILANVAARTQDARVKWAEPNFINQIQPQSIPTDRLLASQWNLINSGQGGGLMDADIHMDEVWNATAYTGNGIYVAVLDCGVQANHPDLTIDPNNPGYDYYSSDADPSPVTEFDNHGTAVAGIIAAKGNNDPNTAGTQPNLVGVAYQAKIVPVRVYETSASGFGYCASSTMANAIYFAGQKAHAMVISLSFSQSSAVDDALHTVATVGSTDPNNPGFRNTTGLPIFCAAGDSASGWVRYTYPLSASASYTFKWEYIKDRSGSEADSVMLDMVNLPGETTEGFEGSFLPSAAWSTWSTDPNSSPWTQVAGGMTGWDGPSSKAAKAPTISDNQSTFIQFSKFLSFSQPTDMSFFAKVGCQNSYPITLGTHSSTGGSQWPFWPKNTCRRTQIIIPASDMGNTARTLTFLDLKLKKNGAQLDSVKVYMGQTTDATTGSWYTGLQQVAEVTNLNLTAINSYLRINFNTGSFPYDGTSNLVVCIAVYDTWVSSDLSYGNVYSSTATNTRCLYAAWSGTDPNSPPAGIQTSNVPIMLLGCGDELRFHVTNGTSNLAYRITGAPAICEYLAYPASHADTIAVGASTNKDYRADYSQFGSGLDFLAPSTGGSRGIYTTDRTDTAGYNKGATYQGGDYYSEFGGTSASAAEAAGVAALLLQQTPAMNAAQLRIVMQSSCDKVHNADGVTYDLNGYNGLYGYGRINAKAAIDLAADATAPSIAAVSPAQGSTPSGPLTSISVTFSEAVRGVTPDDLTVNLVAATGVTGSGAGPYIFTFPAPTGATATVVVSSTGITDLAGNPCTGTLTWQYNLDSVPPTIASISPAANAIFKDVPTSISVTFNEAVTNVSAGQLTVNGSPAINMTGSGAGPYEFSGYSTSASDGTVTVVLAAGIKDLAGNDFAGSSWSYTKDSVPPNRVAVQTFDPNCTDADYVVISFSGVTDGGGSGVQAARLWWRTPNSPNSLWSATNTLTTTDIVNGAGSFTFTWPAGETMYYFYLTYRDAAGNEQTVVSSTAPDASISYDRTPPNYVSFGPMTENLRFQTALDWGVVTPVYLQFFCSDRNSGSGVKVAHMYYRYNGGPWITDPDPENLTFNVPASGGMTTVLPRLQDPNDPNNITYGDGTYECTAVVEDRLGFTMPELSRDPNGALILDPNDPSISAILDDPNVLKYTVAVDSTLPTATISAPDPNIPLSSASQLTYVDVYMDDLPSPNGAAASGIDPNYMSANNLKVKWGTTTHPATTVTYDPNTGIAHFSGYGTPTGTSITVTLAAGTVSKKIRDLAGNLIDTRTWTYVVGTPATISTVVPTQGATITALPSVSVTFSKSVTIGTAGNLTVNGSPATTVTGTSAGPYVYSGFSAPADGAVSVVLASTASYTGNSWTYTKDSTAPTGGSIVINSGADYTTSTAVTLTLSATDAAQMQFSNDNATWSTWEAYATSKAWTLTSGDGLKTVYVRYKDVAGNESASVNDAITLDATGPTGGSIVINSNAAYTGSTAVTLTLAATDAAQMRFNNDNTTWGAWETYATSKAWTLASGDGLKTVYVQFKDAAGNLSASYSDTITLDTASPTVTINQASGQADPATTLPIRFAVVFSKPVTGFTGSDVQVSGTAGGTKTPTVSGSGTTYEVTVAITGATSGTVTITFPAGAAQDSLGNLSAAPTIIDNSVTYNPGPTTVSITGTVNLGNYYTSRNGMTVQVELRRTNGTLVRPAENRTLNGSGVFTLTNVPPSASYRVWVKASHWLSREQAVSIGTSNYTITAPFELPNGDVDGDNEVTTDDQIYLLNHLGETGTDIPGDLDGDEEVTTDDQVYLLNNLGEAGDP